MRLLFIAHRIPYPPNKGDKIRSYHELGFLSRHFEVDLVCFYGGRKEQDYIHKLQGMCASVSGFHRGWWHQATSLIAGGLKGMALSMALYRHRGMQRKIDRLIAKHKYSRIFVFSGQMAQYIPAKLLPRTVVDFCDVDSHKWDNYADRLPFYLAWIYRLEARRLLAFETSVSLKAQASIFITPAELELFRRLGGGGRLVRLGNGVDTEYFHPREGGAGAGGSGAGGSEARAPGTGGPEAGRILFTGAMDYFPNEEGVAWFAREVFPGLRAKIPGARFVIAGSNPSLRVRRLARIEGVEVTGFVPDMRAEQARAQVVVVPLRIARGMQNKVLEAMACGKAVVVSAKALGGIQAEKGRDLLVADSPEEFLVCVERLLKNTGRAEAMGKAARRYIEENFSWERNLGRDLLPLLKGAAVENGGGAGAPPA